MSRVDSLLKQYPGSTLWLYQYTDTMIASQTYFDTAENIAAFYTFTHDSSGKISQRLFYVQDDSVATLYNLWQTTNFIFNEKKRQLEIISFEGDGNAIDEDVVFIYNNEGNISKIVYHAPKAKEEKYVYTKNGNLMQISSNVSKLTEDYIYNDDGLATKMTSNLDGKMLDETAFIYEYHAGIVSPFPLLKSAFTTGKNNETLHRKLYFYNNERDISKVKIHFVVDTKY